MCDISSLLYIYMHLPNKINKYYFYFFSLPDFLFCMALTHFYAFKHLKNICIVCSTLRSDQYLFYSLPLQRGAIITIIVILVSMVLTYFH